MTTIAIPAYLITFVIYAKVDVMTSAALVERPKWDGPAIRAEVSRRNQTLSGLARASGIHESTVRAALIRSQPEGEKVISRFLGVPLHELWPERWDEQGKPVRHVIDEPNHERDDLHRQNSPVR